MKSFVAVVLLVGIVSVSADAGCGLAWEPVNDCGCGDGVGGTVVDNCNPPAGTTLTRVFGRPIQIKPDDAELVLAPSPVVVKPTLIHQSSPVIIRPTVISRPQNARVSVAQPIFRVQSEVQRLPALAANGATQGILSAYPGATHGPAYGCDGGIAHGGKNY